MTNVAAGFRGTVIDRLTGRGAPSTSGGCVQSARGSGSAMN